MEEVTSIANLGAIPNLRALIGNNQPIIMRVNHIFNFHHNRYLTHLKLERNLLEVDREIHLFYLRR